MFSCENNRLSCVSTFIFMETFSLSFTNVDQSIQEQPHYQAKLFTLFLMLHNRLYSVCYRRSTTGPGQMNPSRPISPCIGAV